jgi:hypothetical protein
MRRSMTPMNSTANRKLRATPDRAAKYAQLLDIGNVWGSSELRVFTLRLNRALDMVALRDNCKQQELLRPTRMPPPFAWLFRFLLRRSESFRQMVARMRRGYRASRRIPHDLGIDGLFAALNKQGCHYLALCWFNNLSNPAGMEHLDILIDDDDALVLDRMLTRSPTKGRIRCGVYSVHGLPSFAKSGCAFYPPALATQILERAVRHESGAYMPCLEDQFNTLAFHALYHKGYACGLPVSKTLGPVKHDPKQEYRSALESLARELNLAVPINMEDLDQELDRRGWRPSPDTMIKWGNTNPWCGELADRLLKDLPEAPGLLTCFVRELATDSATISHIQSMLNVGGFVHLAMKVFDDDQKARAIRCVRGGNWGRGAYPYSAGQPAVIIVAIDPSPSRPSRKLRAKNPGADNGRVFEFKKQVRDWWNAQKPPEQHCNIIHVSDSAKQAVHYLQVTTPDDVNTILEGVGAFWERYAKKRSLDDCSCTPLRCDDC